MPNDPSVWNPIPHMPKVTGEGGDSHWPRCQQVTKGPWGIDPKTVKTIGRKLVTPFPIVNRGGMRRQSVTIQKWYNILILYLIVSFLTFVKKQSNFAILWSHFMCCWSSFSGNTCTSEMWTQLILLAYGFQTLPPSFLKYTLKHFLFCDISICHRRELCEWSETNW